MNRNTTAAVMAATCTGVAVRSPWPKEKFAKASFTSRESSVGRVPAAPVYPGAKTDS